MSRYNGKCYVCDSIDIKSGYRCDICYMNSGEITICKECFENDTNNVVPKTCLVCCSRMNRETPISTRLSDTKDSSLFKIMDALKSFDDNMKGGDQKIEKVMSVLQIVLDNKHVFTCHSDKIRRLQSLFRFRITVLKKCHEIIKSTDKYPDSKLRIPCIRLCNKIIETIRFARSPGPVLTAFTIKE